MDRQKPGVIADDLRRHELERTERDRGGEDAERQQHAPFAARTERPLGERQTAEGNENIGQLAGVALQHDGIAEQEPRVARRVRTYSPRRPVASTFTAYRSAVLRDQRDADTVRPAYRPGDQVGVGLDQRVGLSRGLGG